MGKEQFALSPRESACEAEVGCDGTVASFLESQGVGPCLHWSRRYGELYKRMVGLLERLNVVGEVGAASDDAPSEADAPLSPWQDIDASLAEYCAAREFAVPSEVDEVIALHLRALGEWLDTLESHLNGNNSAGREPGSETH